MKKKSSITPIVIIVLVIILGAILITSVVGEGDSNYEAHSGLVRVEGSNVLYYDPVEYTVYILFSEFSGYKGYGYASPYYASNGLPYHYDPQTKQLVRIEWADIYAEILDSVSVG